MQRIYQSGVSRDVIIAAQARDNVIPGKVANLCLHKLYKSPFGAVS